ncbi:MAG: hypothetical protein P4M11_10310, partial [Candidatus Pacebacteria bacterium]|nr:hypothetical protein [Candidatus Paceibacterota bacterium]
CTEIRAWAATVKASTSKIYNKLWDHDKIVAAVNGDSDEVLEKIAALKPSIDYGFPAASVTNPIVQSMYSTLGQKQTTVTSINTNLNSMRTSMSHDTTEIITNSHETNEYLANTLLLSSPTSIAFTAKKKSILIVSLKGNVQMRYIIDTSVIVATVDNVDFYTNWIYSLPYYDVLIFDFYDGFSIDTSGFSSAIQNGIVAFLKRGGSMMATHDVIECESTCWPGELYTYFGIVNANGYYQQIYAETAEKYTRNACHQIFQKPNDFSTMTSIRISYDHTSYADLSAGTLLMTHNGGYLYLVVKETKAGSVVTRCVYTSAGHTDDFSPDEKKLFNNAIYWMLKAS